MKCKGIRFQLPDYVSERLSETEKEAVAGHLASCASCREEVKRLQIVITEIENIATPKPENLYWVNLLPRIHERIETRSSRSIPEWLVRCASPVAGVAVLCVFLMKITTMFPADESQKLRGILGELQQEEVQDLADVPSASGFLETSIPRNEQSVTTPSDREAIGTLLAAEEKIFSYDGMDVQSIVQTMDDRDIATLVTMIDRQTKENTIQ